MTPPPDLAGRRAAYAIASAKLATLSDAELAALVATAQPLDLRGRTQPALIDVDGVPVFVKSIPLTDVERDNPHSTRNLFRLPLYYQYGVGSFGFGVWRELAAARMASDWALTGACEGFPLLHHWRVLPREPITLDDKWCARGERYVAYWNGSAAIAARLETFRAATASVTLFLEYIPGSLDTYLRRRLAEDREAGEAALLWAHDQLDEIAAFLIGRGVTHFDLHYHNVLTDGRAVYVTDFGLANAASFELSAMERHFVERRRLYDRCYLANAVSAWLAGLDDSAPTTAALLQRIERHRPVADLMGPFFTALRETSKTTRYPAAKLERAFARIA